uniref:Uncharacterized protein n=1 Tax=Poecilia latipinna TaxID=48699 RepID=A0A3B3UP27_9TELE
MKFFQHRLHFDCHPVSLCILQVLCENTTKSPGLNSESPGLNSESPGLNSESPGLNSESPGLNSESPGFTLEVKRVVLLRVQPHLSFSARMSLVR